MTKYNGNGLAVSFDGNLVPTTFLKSCETDEAASASESSGIGDSSETHLVTTNKTTASLDMWDDAADAVIWDFFIPGTTGILIIYPQGVGLGKPKETCSTAICTGRGQGAPFNEVMPMTASFDVSGGFTDGTQ